jgi:hypothetical protein
VCRSGCWNNLEAMFRMVSKIQLGVIVNSSLRWLCVAAFSVNVKSFYGVEVWTFLAEM